MLFGRSHYSPVSCPRAQKAGETKEELFVFSLACDLRTSADEIGSDPLNLATRSQLVQVQLVLNITGITNDYFIIVDRMK